MQNVMKQAWAIARTGQKNFGGRVSEYFAEALRMAWRIAKGMEDLRIDNEVREVSGREWQNYGKHRVYLEALIEFTYTKTVNGNDVRVRAGIKFDGYYDVQTKRLVESKMKRFNLNNAPESVKKYAEKEFESMINQEIKEVLGQ